MREQRFWQSLALITAVCGVPLLLPAPSRFGGIFLCILALCCACQYSAVRHSTYSKAALWTARIGRALFGLFIASFAVVQGIIFYGMHCDPEATQADAVLVLGAQVYALDRPSATLEKRLDTALAYLEIHPKSIAVLCGGQGKNEPVAEAAAMYHYLVQYNINPDRLVLDDSSVNTIENIQNAKALLKQRFPKGCKTAVISSDFHMARARRLMEHAGLDPYGLPAPTPYLYQRAALHLREYCSIMGLILSGRW